MFCVCLQVTVLYFQNMPKQEMYPKTPFRMASSNYIEFKKGNYTLNSTQNGTSFNQMHHLSSGAHWRKKSAVNVGNLSLPALAFSIFRDSQWRKAL